MPNPVVVGVDDPLAASAALDWATDEAQQRSLPLQLVHAPAWNPRHPPDDDAAQSIRRADERGLRGLAARAVGRHRGLKVSTCLAGGTARIALVAASEGAELLVLGSQGSGGLPELLIGSTSLHVAAHAACPVVVVPGTGERPAAAAPATRADGYDGYDGYDAEGRSLDGVAVGIDGAGPSDGPLAFAFETAQRRGLPLRVVHTWSYPLAVGPGHAFPPVYEAGQVGAEATRLLAEVLAGWRQKFPEVRVTEDVVRSGAARHLVEVSANQQLLVVGRRGRPDGPVGRLGSVSQTVVHQTRCPVAVLPED